MARVLGEVVDRVEVLERGRVSDPGARLVPMQRRIPVLLSGHDLTRLERWFPDLADDLTRRGAVHTEPDGDGLAVARPVLLDDLRRLTLAAGIERIDEHPGVGISVDVKQCAGGHSAGRQNQSIGDSAKRSMPARASRCRGADSHGTAAAGWSTCRTSSMRSTTFVSGISIPVT